MDADRLIAILKDEKFQSALAIGADITAIGNPVGAAVVTAFKEVASISDEIRCQYILRGMASGLNQEKFTTELIGYVKGSEDNAAHVSNTIRKAMLSESPIACALMGWIMAKHIADKKPFDRDDVIIVHAVGSATDEDLTDFMKMMQTVSDEGIIAVRNEFEECADWCVSNRMCKEDRVSYQQDTETLEFFSGIIPSSAAKRLEKYLDDMRVAGILRWNQSREID